MDPLSNYFNMFGDYVDTYTPQQATREGYAAGIKTAIDLIHQIEKPTKQVKTLLAELEKKLNG